MAYLALKGLLARVLPLMDGQVHFGVIPLRTAFVRTSVFVYHILRTLLRGLGAVCAVQLLDVGLQVALQLECPIANVTRVRSRVELLKDIRISFWDNLHETLGEWSSWTAY